MPVIEAAHEKVKENPDEEPSNFMLAYLAEIERRAKNKEDMGSFRYTYSLAQSLSRFQRVAVALCADRSLERWHGDNLDDA